MGSEDLLQRLSALARSASARRRAVAIEVAGKLYRRRGSSHEPFALAQTQALLLQALQDPAPRVRRAAAYGISERPHPDSLPLLLRELTHPDPSLRLALCVALGRCEAAAAIDALIRLAQDTEAEVRNWATFGLGTLREEADTPALREQLVRNLGDANDEVRGEALCGLAARRDPRALTHLLTSPNVLAWRVFELEAAKQLADPCLLPQLRALQAQAATRPGIYSYWQHHLEDAVTACEGGA